MKISYVKFKGFRGAKDEVTIPLSPGFVIISGRNGSGKSTICDAVEYAITGTLSKFADVKEAGESVESYVWWRGDAYVSDAYVAVGLMDDDGTQREIRRNELSFLDGQNATDMASIFKLPGRRLDAELKALCTTSILRDETIASLSIDAGEQERSRMVEAVVGDIDLSKYNQTLDDARKSIEKRKKAAHDSALNFRGQLQIITADLAKARSRISTETEARQALETVQTALNVQPGEQKNFSRLALTRMNEIQKNLTLQSALESDLEAWLSLVEGNFISTQREQLSTLEVEHEALKEFASVAELELIAAQASVESFQALEPRIMQLAELVQLGQELGLQDGKCPLCSSPVSEEKFRGHIHQVHAEIERHKKDLTGLIEKRDLWKRRHGIAVSKVNENLSKSTQLRVQLKNIEDQEAMIRQKLAALNIATATLDAQLLQTIRERISRGKEAFLALRTSVAVLERSPMLSKIADLESSQSRIQVSIDTQESFIAKADTALAQLKETKDSIRRFAGDAFDERADEVAPIMNEMYKRLRPHSDWNNLRFNIRGDVTRLVSLRVEGAYKDAEVNPRFIFSSGQRRAAGLSFLLSLNLSRGWSNLRSLLLDDPVQHIDDFRALQLTELLAAVRLTGRQVICTVEDEALAQLMTRRLPVRNAEEALHIKMHYVGGQGVSVEEVRRLSPMPLAVIAQAS